VVDSAPLAIQIARNGPFAFPTGFFWYATLTVAGGIIAWRATRAGVLAAFKMQQEDDDRRRTQGKALVISKLVGEFELAKSDLEKFVEFPDYQIEVEFSIFYGTLKQQVEHLYAVDPSFMRLMHSYLETFKRGIHGLRQGHPGTGRGFGEPADRTPEVSQAGVLIKLIDEVVFMLEHELSDEEMASYRQVREEDKRKRGEHLDRMKEVLVPGAES